MSGLFSSLSSAARAMEAQRFGLDVTGQNIANVNTPGYAHREVLLASVPPYTKLSAGEGVEVQGFRAARDERLERRLQQELPAERREAAIAQSLAVVETALGKPGESIDAQLSEFFGAMSRFAAEPTSAIARQGVASQGATLAGSFRDMAGRLDAARRDADAGVRDSVDQINALAERIAKINASLGTAPGGAGALSLKDELGEALKSLSELIDIGTIPRADGGMDVTFANGRPLVVADNTYAVGAVSGPPSGFASITSAGVDVTSEIGGGTVGGLIEARDVRIPGYLDQLDALAYAVVTEVNTVHQSGYDLNGATGHDFFTPLASAAGAARAITVDAGILANPSTIAGGGTATAGDNTVARQLATLKDAKVLDGGTATLSDGWGDLVYRVGADSKAAQFEQASRAEIVQQVELLREQVSGVSLDEEAMLMMKFQRAYEANAKFFTAVDSAIDTLLNMVGR